MSMASFGNSNFLPIFFCLNVCLYYSFKIITVNVIGFGYTLLH